MHARLAAARKELPRAVRIAVAAVLAWWIARLLGADRPVFAVIVPMVAIRDDTYAALSLSLGRMLGVMAGVVLGIGVVAVAGVSTTAIVLLLVAGLAIGLFLRTGPELNTQIAISALLVLIVTEDADSYALERIWETGVGSVVALRRGGVRAAARSARGQPAPARRDGARRWPAISPPRRATLARGDPSARALLAHADEHARAAGARRRGSAEGAARAAPEPAAARRSRAQLDVVDRRQRLALRLAIQVRRLARDLASFAAPRRSARRVGRGRAAPAADHRGGGRRLGQGARRRGLLARGRRGARAASRPTSARTAARSPRSCGGRSCCSCDELARAAGMSSPMPAGEEAELAALRALARRLGVGDDVRMLSPWTPLPAIPPADVCDPLGRRRPAAALLARARARGDGSAGKTTTARLAEAMLRASGDRDLAAERRARRQRLADGRPRRSASSPPGRPPGAWPS